MKQILIPFDLTPEMLEVFRYYQATQATEQVDNPQSPEEFAIARAQEGIKNLFYSDVARHYGAAVAYFEELAAKAVESQPTQ